MLERLRFCFKGLYYLENVWIEKYLTVKNLIGLDCKVLIDTLPFERNGLNWIGWGQIAKV